MNETEILNFVRRARRGDNAAFDRLIELCSRQVFYLVLPIVGDFSLSEDIVQEVFIQAYKMIGELRDDAKFRPWLFSIARNKSLSFVHRRNRRPDSFGLPVDEIVSHSNSMYGGNTAEENDTAQRRTQVLLERMRLLPENQQRLLMFKYVEKMKVAEIAEIEGLSENAVRNHLYRSRKLLRGMLQDER